MTTLGSGTDVVVCGAGAAGMAAAIAAARAGAEVLLVETTPGPGGTVANALIHTIGGLYDSRGEILNGGLAAELASKLIESDGATCKRRMGRTWVLNACPDHYVDVVTRWVGSEPRLKTLYGSRVSQVETAGSRVTVVELSGAHGALRVRPRAVIDATGTAELVRLIKPGLLQHDPRRAAGGLIVRLRGIAAGAVRFPGGLAIVRALRIAVAEGRLPPGCANAWLDSGIAADEAYLKLAVPVPDDWREHCGEITRSARLAADSAVALLRAMPGFAEARVDRIGALGIRDGGRVLGEYVLTEADVCAGRRFADAACRCCWPIEYWDPDRGVLMEYLPEGTFYEIPLRALRVRGLSNVWVAGKCLSADPLAHASARVAGCCWSMGEAAGRAAVS